MESDEQAELELKVDELTKEYDERKKMANILTGTLKEAEVRRCCWTRNVSQIQVTLFEIVFFISVW